MYIHQRNNWPHFHWRDQAIMDILISVRHEQGKIIGKMAALGFDMQNEASLETLILDVLKSTQIEGIILNPEQVRSSLARRLGIAQAGIIATDRHIDGVVDMMLDATGNYDKPLTRERLLNWHHALFPTGHSGLYKINVGSWRKDTEGPMRVVSGLAGREKIHYQAPAAKRLEEEIRGFLYWFNGDRNIDPVLKAGIAHLWFVSLHPFDDGNGRITRAVTDMLLARSDGLARRFYSMSAQIQKERKAYYDILEKTQKGDLEITEWLIWFLNCLGRGIQASEVVLANVIYKHRFWNLFAHKIRNDRQRLILNKILEGFEGKLTSSKWARIAKCSPDTALRDIQDLMNKGILQKSKSAGRSTSYDLVALKE